MMEKALKVGTVVQSLKFPRLIQTLVELVDPSCGLWLMSSADRPGRIFGYESELLKNWRIINTEEK